MTLKRPFVQGVSLEAVDANSVGDGLVENETCWVGHMSGAAAEPTWSTWSVPPSHLTNRARQHRWNVGGDAAGASIVIGGGNWQVGSHARDNRTNDRPSGWMDEIGAASPAENRCSAAPIGYRAQVGQVAMTTPTEDSL